MSCIREAIKQVQAGADPQKVSEALVVESALADFVSVIQDTISELDHNGKAQISIGNGSSDKILYFIIEETVFKMTPKEAKFIAIGPYRDLENVVQRDIEALLNFVEDPSVIKLDSHLQNMNTLASRGATKDLMDLCKRRFLSKSKILAVFKDIFGFSQKDVEKLFGESWEEIDD